MNTESTKDTNLIDSKMFMAFAFDCYYPGGADNDFVGTFKTFEEAKNAAIVKKRDFIVIYNIAQDLWTDEDGIVIQR